ncbi:MAG: hypothetical protein K5895_03840 [Lachnospiraceae bacterium]|nr:hypothetical protein [Lachnospiraceae bacterium]
MRVPWNEDEAIIIVDAFYQYKNGIIKKNDAIKSVSTRLREMAIQKGFEIDDVFRNVNGITMQMATLEHIFSNGEKDLRSGSELFRDIMQLYVDNNAEFELKKERIKSEPMKERFSDFIRSHFAYGIRIDSPIEIMRLRKFYTEDFGEECQMTDDEIKKMLFDSCFIHDGKGYIMASETEEKIQSEIDELQHQGNQIIYYEELHAKNEEWFYSLGIFSSEMLKSYLSEKVKTVTCKKSFFAWEMLTENELLKKNITSLWGEYVLLDYLAIKNNMEYVPIDKIKYALANNSCFVWNSAETYTIEDRFVISEDEKNKILEYVANNINGKGNVAFDDMPLESVFEENYELSDNAIFALVYNLVLSTKYERANRTVTIKGQENNPVKLLELFCKSKRELSVDELFEEWELKTGTRRQSTPLEVAYSTMIRIDENRFVSDDQVYFNEPAIDDVLDTIISGEAVGMKEISSFALFPECNYTWNLFILESFCRRFSKTFKYMAVTTNSRNAGAIVRKKCDYDYHTLLAHMLAQSNVDFTEDAVMDFLVEKGFVGRHSYKYLSDLIELAFAIRTKGEKY